MQSGVATAPREPRLALLRPNLANIYAHMVFSLDDLFYERPDMRQSLFKKSGYMYKNTEFKASSVDVKEIDTCLNTSENMKEVRKEGLWINNHHAPITKDSDFTLHRVNNEDIVSENGIKIQSFSNTSEILDMTVAPIKALCSQRFDDWKEKFGPIGLTCKELTGDTVVDDLFEIHNADIIITTPEKWDSMTRRWRDNCIVQLVRLVLIDEVHVIKDESRGATLEVVVSRMKTIQSSLWRLVENHDTVPPLRFVAVSATIPNTEDIAEWLSDSKMPAVCLKIDEDQRPVKLRKIVLGFPCSDNQTEFKFDLTLNYKIASIIQSYSEQKPALVFCATRKGVQQAASVLAKDAKFLLSIEQKQRLQKLSNSLKDSKLRGFSSGLDKMGIEGKLQELCLKNLNDLSSFDLIRMDEENNFKPTETGRLMAWYYIAFDTVKQFFTIKGTETLNELITMISNCAEFLDVKLRTNEKKILNSLNKDKDKTTISEEYREKVNYYIDPLGALSKEGDSVLLKTGNWMKKIEVKRAVKSEDISINLISSDYVGFDIQQAYTAFYLAPKPGGHKVATNQKLKAGSALDVCCGSSQSLPAAKVDTGGRSKQEIAYKKYGNRECNHRCKNKDMCGHDCCKTGVPPRSQMNGDTEISLYLADLRSRNSISSAPPVKRLKIQMLNQSQNVDLKQFGFTPKSSLPALPRSSNKDLSLSPSVDQVDNVNNLGVSQQQLQSWNYGRSNALDVNFETRDDIWDDIDDEKLVFASNFVSRELVHDEADIQNLDVSVVSSTLKGNLSVQSRNATLLNFQEKNHSNSSQELKNIQSSPVSKTISDSSKLTRKEDFFIFTKEQKKEVDPRYVLDDEINDIKPFLGIFDGIL
ncbi:hypothetical protein WISP_108614 [Willisornis vidua]|uniref:Helicase ATP-binding domain-containing protein n=1 Tax=Willisornis vidua TaxID=1566151 RepID=A0ABQ9D259_9PASS|nr:hypothetical protein WISP_108614 [Willisornis vidua]